MDFNKLSRKEIEKVIQDAERALKTIEKREMQAARKAAEEAAAKYGFKLAELTGGAGAQRKTRGAGSASPASAGAPKYANPANPDQTWTGKGRQPKWFKDALAAGKSAASLEI